MDPLVDNKLETQEAKPQVEVLYRYREMQMDEIYDTRPIEASKAMRLYRDSYPVIKRTKCGCWIDLGYGRKKFVNLDARRKWAHESLEDAMKSFAARKNRQITILRHQLLKAQAAVFLKAEDAHSLRMGMFHFE